MEFLFELLTEIILEGTIMGSQSKVVPRPVRILLLFFMVGFYVFMIAVFGIILFRCGNTGVRVLLIGVELLFLWFVIHTVRKFYKKWKE